MSEILKTSSNKKTFVLVHGAWHGGWCWRRVEDALRAQGHRVFCPTLTGVGERSHLLSGSVNLDTHVADVANLIAWEDLAGVVLVGHSYGGFVISGAAERLGSGAISSLVFLDAFVPQDGDTLIESITTPALHDFLEGFVKRGEIGAKAPPAAAFKVNERDRAWVDAKCTPHPVSSMTQHIRLSGARERVKSKIYIRAAGFDSPVFAETYERLRKEPSWRLHEIDSGHDVMVDRPDELTALLLDQGL